MAKRITKLSKLSKQKVRQIMKEISEGDLRPMEIKSSDGTAKNAVLFNDETEELLVILDNVTSKKDLELMERELQNMQSEGFDDSEEAEVKDED